MLESRELFVEELQAALQRLAVAVVVGNFDLAQDAGALQQESVTLTADFGLLGAQSCPPGVGAAFLGFLLLLLYVFALETSCHVY